MRHKSGPIATFSPPNTGSRRPRAPPRPADRMEELLAMIGGGEGGGGTPCAWAYRPGSWRRPMTGLRR